MHPTPCPVCNEPGGFHGPAKHTEARRLADRRRRLDELIQVTEELGLYEDDEPVADAERAFDEGDKGVTAVQDRL